MSRVESKLAKPCDVSHEWAVAELLKLRDSLASRGLWEVETDDLEVDTEDGPFSIVEAAIAAYDDVRQQLADRKIIERAKGIVMHRLNVTEAEAFKKLQRFSANKNMKLAAMAQRIVDVAEALGE